MADQTVKGHPSTAARRFKTTHAGGPETRGPGPAHMTTEFHGPHETPRRPAARPAARRSTSGRSATARRRAPGGGARRRGGGGGGYDEGGSYFDGEGGGEGQRPIFVRGRQATQQYAAKQFRATSRVLIAEWLIALIIVVLKPSEPTTGLQGDGQQPAPASESVVPQLVGIMGVFFVLALVGTAGPRPQRFANLFGALVDIALLFKNHGPVLASLQGVVTPAKSTPPAGAPSATTNTTTTGTAGNGQGNGRGGFTGAGLGSGGGGGRVLAQ